MLLFLNAFAYKYNEDSEGIQKRYMIFVYTFSLGL